MNYLYFGGNALNGLVSIDGAGVISIDNKQYTVRLNRDTGTIELVNADGVVTPVGSVGGAALEVNELANINRDIINSWVGASANIDVPTGRPANSRLKAIITLTTDALVNGTIPNQTADITAGIVPFVGAAMVMSAAFLSGEALKSSVPNLVAKQDLDFAGGVGANVAAGNVRLTFTGVVAGVPSAFVGGQFSAGAFKVFGIWEKFPTATELNNL